MQMGENSIILSEFILSLGKDIFYVFMDKFLLNWNKMEGDNTINSQILSFLPAFYFFS